MTKKVVAILQVMWDWNSMTSDAGYVEQAPSYYRINPDNRTGSRLYAWLGKKGEYYNDLLVTNACPELVTSAKGRGKPDKKWLEENLRELWPFDTLLVCGRVAQETFAEVPWNMIERSCRIVETPHPVARMWSNRSLDRAGLFIREGTSDVTLRFEDGYLRAYPFLPF